jgi:hypothetical protein
MELGFVAILAIADLVATLLVGTGFIAARVITGPKVVDCRPIDPVTYEVLSETCETAPVATMRADGAK